MTPAGRIQATYQLAAPTRRRALASARDLVVEQTVEVPADCVPPPSRGMVGTIERLERAGRGRWRAACSYDPALVGDSLPQLLNLLFGHPSLLPGVRLVDVEFPDPPPAGLAGPAFGLEGIRRLCGVPSRPLLCSVAKPVGLSPSELARRCHDFAMAGTDIIKDDHGLANQAAAPFRERVLRCQEAVAAANAETGGRALYFPNLSRGIQHLWEDLEQVRSAGCRGVLLCPLLMGLDTLRALASRSQLAILSHPSFAGGLLQPRQGIAPDVFYGVLLRAIGSDGVIYPNAGGRFPVPLATCRAINRRLGAPLSGFKPALPVAGGGIDAARVPYWIKQYGTDIMFLVGSSLYAQRDLRSATARLVDSIRRSV
jgi:ribulose-bisphosphate carboxylase large chain